MEKNGLKQFLWIGKTELICCLILSFFRAWSVYFYNINDLPSGAGVAFMPVLHFILSMAVLYSVFIVGNHLLRMPCKKPASKMSDIKLFVLSFLVLLVLWLPYLIISYPGAMSWDTWIMFDEFLSDSISNYQSVTYTYLFIWFFRLSVLLGNINLSLFFLSCSHYILYAVIFAYSFVVLRKLGVPSWFKVMTWLVYAFNPLITGYIGVAIKDCVYSVLLFGSFLVMVEIYMAKTGKLPVRKYVALAAMIIVACLVRKNGIYVYAGVILAMFLCSMSKKAQKNEIKAKTRVTVSAALVIYLLIYMSIQTVVRPVPDNTTEMYSLPFQQTARYVRDHGEELTPEQIEIIDNVLEYDTLAERYDPMISDPVKERSYGSFAVTGPYFKLWFEQFFKHPGTYFAATGEQNYYLLSPEAEVTDITYFINAHEFYQHATYYPINTYENLFCPPDSVKGLQNALFRYNVTVQFLPFVNLLWNGSYAFYFLAIVTAYFISRKKDVSILAVFWMTILFVVIGPAIYGHPRYLFPIIYSLPVLFAYLYYLCREDEAAT